MQKRKKVYSANGITLIALVISIIVMLILAGVSINAIVGEDGIITKAKDATYLQSRAVLEEFLQEKYVEKYDEFDDAESKIVSLQNLYPEYFYIPSHEGIGTLKYVIDNDGYALYLIKKSGLPKEIRDQLVGGEAGDGTYLDYKNLKDVYGVTSDLKVYYSLNGKSELLGMSTNDLDLDNPNRTVFSGNEYASNTSKNMYNLIKSYDLDGNQEISASEVRQIRTLELTAESGISSLLELHNFVNLNNLKLKNLTLDSLEGISKATMISTLDIENCIINNYDDLSNLVSLIDFNFIYNNSSIDGNAEVRKLCGTNNDGHFGMSKGKLSNLNQLFIGPFNYWTLNVTRSQSNITDLSPLCNLKEETKLAIQRLEIQNNPITSIEFVNSFLNLNYINVGSTNIKNFKGISTLKKLTYISMYSNTQFGISDGENINDTNNALYDVQFCTSLSNIYIGTDDCIKYISYIKNLKNLSKFECNSQSLDINDLTDTIPFLKSINYRVNTKYSLLFLDSKTTNISLIDQTIDKDTFEGLGAYENINTFVFVRTTITENGTNLGLEESNELINNLLKQWKNLVYLDLCGAKINTVDFIFDSEKNVINCPNLKSICLMDTNVTDLSYLEKVTIDTLGINNSNIDLTKIQKTISSCGTQGYGSAVHGYAYFYCNNSNLLKKLENCTEITSIISYANNWGGNNGVTLDLSKCTKLKTLMFTQQNINLKLPSSIENLTIKDSGTFPDLANCKNLKNLTYSKNGAYDRWSTSNVVDSLKSKVKTDGVATIKSINLFQLDELTDFIDIGSKYKVDAESKLTIQNCKNFTTTNGIGDMNDLTYLNLNANANLNSLTSLNKLFSLTYLYSNCCAIMNLDEIKDLSMIGYIDFRNNSLVDNSLDIIAKIREKNANLKVYLSGNNNIVDWSALSKYNNWWHDSEKAGY